MPRTTDQHEASFTTPIMVSQNAAATAVALSGVTQVALRESKQNFLWLTADSAIRYRWDGLCPTTSIGHKLAAGTPLQLVGRKKIVNFRFIRDGAVSAVVTFTLDATEDTGGLQ